MFAQVRQHGAEKCDSLACSILAPPAGFEPAHTAPECNPAYSCYQRERGLGCLHGARMGREIVVLQLSRLLRLRP